MSHVSIADIFCLSKNKNIHYHLQYSQRVQAPPPSLTPQRSRTFSLCCTVSVKGYANPRTVCRSQLSGSPEKGGCILDFVLNILHVILPFVHPHCQLRYAHLDPQIYFCFWPKGVSIRPRCCLRQFIQYTSSYSPSCSSNLRIGHILMTNNPINITKKIIYKYKYVYDPYIAAYLNVCVCVYVCVCESSFAIYKIFQCSIIFKIYFDILPLELWDTKAL
jgi:hypothetical protein